jgi:hypothetical protein
MNRKQLFELRKEKLCLREKEKRMLKFGKTSCMPAIAEDEKDHWSDEVFVAEMKKRALELESGKVKGKSWEEVKTNARKSLSQIKSKCCAAL